MLKRTGLLMLAASVAGCARYEGGLVSAENVDLFCRDRPTGVAPGDVNLSNVSQEQLDALACLTRVQGDLIIWQNDALTDLSGLSSLAAVDGELVIDDNDEMVGLAGLGSLATIDFLSISENASLVDLSGLSGLEDVEISFVISHNDALESLTGLEQLQSAGLALRINDNPVLCQEEAFELAARTGVSCSCWDNTGTCP